MSQSQPRSLPNKPMAASESGNSRKSSRVRSAPLNAAPIAYHKTIKWLLDLIKVQYQIFWRAFKQPSE